MLNKDYEKIANMTNKEAAEVIKSMLINVQVGRGNGKTLGMLKYNTALQKAVAVLGNTPDSDFVRDPEGYGRNPRHSERSALIWRREAEKQTNPNQSVELLDDTSMYQGMNESYPDYCKRLAKILGMVTDTCEQDAIDRVEAFFKVFNEIPLTNAYSPEDIKAGLEKEKPLYLKSKLFKKELKL